MDNILTIKVNYENRTVKKSDYIVAKTKQLREFGYTSLLEWEVERELNNILAGSSDLTVIGRRMESDIVVDKNEPYDDGRYKKK